PDNENKPPEKKVVIGPPLREVYVLPADPEPAWTLTQTEYGILIQGEPVPAEDSIRWGAFGAYTTGLGTLMGPYYTISPTEIVKKGAGPTLAYFGLITYTL